MSTIPMHSFSLPSIEAKVVVVGSQSVGKTSIAKRFVENSFMKSTSTTIGASFLTKRISLNQTSIKLQIWDTAGQERFKSMTPLFFRGADVAICVYDVTQQHTFEALSQWIEQLKRYSDCFIYVVGNKSDLLSSTDTNQELAELIEIVSENQVRQFAELNGAIYFPPMSALNDSGIEELFLDLSQRLLKQRQPKTSKAAETDFDFLMLTKQQKPSSCC